MAAHETLQFRPRPAQAEASSRSSRSGSADAAASARRAEYGVRPAVSEQRAKGLLARLPIPQLPEVSLPESPAVRRGLVALAVLVVVAGFLYGPVRSLYAATRDEQVYTAQLEELNASNEQLRSEVDRLQSREGIEDEARKRGYVLEGETPVMVDGLEVDDRGTADASASAAQSLDEDAPWYVSFLDFLFGYEAPELVSK